jgi:anti-sigma factor RsiW
MIDNFDGEPGMDGGLDERFELLSAYLDGEATVSERQQVEAWLASDRAFQQQYRQMQRMQVAVAAIPVPSSNRSATQLADAVFTKIDRRRSRNLTRWFGGGAIAATLMAALAGIGGLIGTNNSQLQMANKANTPAPLMVALNDPILLMPTKNEGMQVPMSLPEVNADEVN